jgi:hypothetical protein
MPDAASVRGRVSIPSRHQVGDPHPVARDGERLAVCDGFQVHHAEVLRILPPHHRDPFDRMLVAQAIADGLTLVTSDAKLGAYPVRLGGLSP